jgi:hypothetical protein
VVDQLGPTRGISQDGTHVASFKGATQWAAMGNPQCAPKWVPTKGGYECGVPKWGTKRGVKKDCPKKVPESGPNERRFPKGVFKEGSLKGVHQGCPTMRVRHGSQTIGSSKGGPPWG